MTARHDKPTVRRAAQMMPPGPDRDALFARAGQIFAGGPGPFLEKRIAAVQRALEMIWAAQEAQYKADPAQPPAQAREHLRYENQLDRLNRAHDALWEDAFRDAREELFRLTGKRTATPIYEVDEHWQDMKDRMYHDAYYAKHRPGVEAGFKPAPQTPRPARKPDTPAPTNDAVRALAEGLDQIMKEAKGVPPKPGDAA